MAQAGYTQIQLYLSTTASAVPSAGNLANGELAINITDGKLFYKDNGGVVQVLATKGAGTIGGSNTQVQYNNAGALAGSANLTFDGTTLTAAGLAGPHNGTVGATTPNTGAFTTLSASSTVSGAGFSTYLASPPAIGGTSANAGAFTTLAASGTVTFSGGTANGVAYLNGSKVLTTGSALTFDGTSLQAAAARGTYALKIYNSSDGSVVGNFGALTGNVFAIDATGPANTMTFLTGGSEQMRLTSTGLGIGTSSPGFRLQVNGFVGVTDGTSTIRLANSGGVGLVSTVTNHPLAFQTNDIERARITSSGNLLVGSTTTPTVTYGNPRVSTGSSAFCVMTDSGVYEGQAASTVLQYVALWKNPNGTVGSIATNGSSTTYATSSDYRLKENIQPMTGALAKVAALKPCTYKWKADGSDGEGFIAHELQAVVPQCVTGEKDAVDAEGKPVYQGIDTSFLVATLTAAIQEQQAIINAQSAALEQLKAQLTSVSADVAALKAAA